MKNSLRFWRINFGYYYRSLGQEDLLEEGMATHSSILAWRVPWAEEPGGLQFPSLLRIFQFVVMHTIKGFRIVSKAEVDVFLNSLAFSMIQWVLAIWSLVPPVFLNPAWTSGSSRFVYCWSLAWKILSITSLVREMSATVHLFELSLALPFFGTGMKTDLFPGHFKGTAEEM